MELLSIKSEKGKGVYICNNKKEKADILKQYPGCSSRVFAENEKEKALSWAGVKEISNRPQQVVDIPLNNEKQKKPENDFLVVLKTLRNKGYSYVKVTLTNEKTFMLWLDSIKYLSLMISPSYIKSKRYYDFNYDGSIIKTFSDWSKKINNYYNDSAEYEEALYECFKELPKRCTYKGIYKQMEKPIIQSIGDMAIISSVFSKLTTTNNGEIYKYVENDIIEDFVFNTKTVLSIEPYKLDFEITDKEFLRVIDKLEKEGINCEVE